MQLDFNFSIGDKVVYNSGNISGTIVGLYQYKNDPPQALMEYVSKDGSLCSLWRSEIDFTLAQ